MSSSPSSPILLLRLERAEYDNQQLKRMLETAQAELRLKSERVELLQHNLSASRTREQLSSCSVKTIEEALRRAQEEQQSAQQERDQLLIYLQRLNAMQDKKNLSLQECFFSRRRTSTLRSILQHMSEYHQRNLFFNKIQHNLQKRRSLFLARTALETLAERVMKARRISHFQHACEQRRRREVVEAWKKVEPERATIRIRIAPEAAPADPMPSESFARSFGLVMDKSGKILLAPKSLGEGTKPAAHAERKGAALADKEALSRLRELQPAVLANSPMKSCGANDPDLVPRAHSEYSWRKNSVKQTSFSQLFGSLRFI